MQPCPSCGASAIDRSAVVSGQVTESSVDAMAGRTVDQYVIGHKLSEDSFGALYHAEQISIGRKSVVKILHPWLSRDADVVRRFEREARAAARLQNPHIASIYSYGRLGNGTLYLAKEHTEGVTLAERLRAEGRLEPARAVAIATQCLEGLAEAHRRSMVHGALEPAKIVLVPRGGPDFVKLIDVGISLLQPTHEDARGRHQQGRPQYMAPEQFTGTEVDHRSDLYSLGIVVYEMLVGSPPFREESLQAYQRRHENDPPPALAQSSPGLVISPAIDACVMRALAKSPHHRPQSADSFADELWSALMATVERPDLPMPTRRHRAGHRAGRRRRRPRAAVVAAVGAIAGSAIGIGVGTLFLRPAAPPLEQAAGTIVEDDAALQSRHTPLHEAAASVRSLDELEIELRQAIASRQSSPRAPELTLQAYREAAAHPPFGTDGDTYRKALLARLIVAWRAPDAHATTRELSLDELEAAFLTMRSPLVVTVRRTMLNGLKQAARQEPDPRATIRSQLVPWIEAYGKNVDFTEEEAQIEIVEADSDG
jgi:hypothetical protein